ncbi:MAG: GNAT family N-acetyltransferase [Planctomycetaceae bacterium]
MLQIVPATGGLRDAALSLLYRHLPRGEREAHLAELIAASRRGDVSLDGVMAAVRDGALVATVLTVQRAGRMAMLWPPSFADTREAFSVGRPLLEKTCAGLDAAGVLFAQCLRDPADDALARLLEAAGIPHITDMAILSRETVAGDRRLAVDLPSVAYDETRQEQFARVLEQTCEQSLDCSELAGLRSGAEILEAHRDTGTFDKALWRIYQSNGHDAGLLLAADHFGRHAREIVYLGVIPAQRGRGLGRAMLQSALGEAGRTGVRTVEVAVDVRNSYAADIYRELGFEEVSVLAVHLRLRPGVCEGLA